MGIICGLALACPILILTTCNLIVGFLAELVLCFTSVCVVAVIPLANWKLGVCNKNIRDFSLLWRFVLKPKAKLYRPCITYLKWGSCLLEWNIKLNMTNISLNSNNHPKQFLQTIINIYIIYSGFGILEPLSCCGSVCGLHRPSCGGVQRVPIGASWGQGSGYARWYEYICSFRGVYDNGSCVLHAIRRNSVPFSVWNIRYGNSRIFNTICYVWVSCFDGSMRTRRRHGITRCSLQMVKTEIPQGQHPGEGLPWKWSRKNVNWLNYLYLQRFINAYNQHILYIAIFLCLHTKIVFLKCNSLEAFVVILGCFIGAM